MTLQWRNNTGAAIRLFKAYETNGGTNYLFDAATGLTQTNFLVIPATAMSLPIKLFHSARLSHQQPCPSRSDHFIFCGTAYGNDELVLQVTNQYGGVVGEASVFLNLKDIKQMYERWTVGEDPNALPTTLHSPTTVCRRESVRSISVRLANGHQHSLHSVCAWLQHGALGKRPICRNDVQAPLLAGLSGPFWLVPLAHRFGI